MNLLHGRELSGFGLGHYMNAQTDGSLLSRPWPPCEPYPCTAHTMDVLRGRRLAVVEEFCSFLLTRRLIGCRLWMWIRQHPRNPDLNVILLDTEGLDAPHVSQYCEQ